MATICRWRATCRNILVTCVLYHDALVLSCHDSSLLAMAVQAFVRVVACVWCDQVHLCHWTVACQPFRDTLCCNLSFDKSRGASSALARLALVCIHHGCHTVQFAWIWFFQIDDGWMLWQVSMETSGATLAIDTRTNSRYVSKRFGWGHFARWLGKDQTLSIFLAHPRIGSFTRGWANANVINEKK